MDTWTVSVAATGQLFYVAAAVVSTALVIVSGIVGLVGGVSAIRNAVARSRSPA